MDFFEKTVRDIKSLKIQGATKIAKEAIKAFKWKAGKIKTRNKKDFLKKLWNTEQILITARSTEPLMRNVLRYIYYVISESNLNEQKDMVNLIEITAEEFLFNLKKQKQSIEEIGSRMIRHNSTIFTHCHSSTVTGILKLAWKSGKRFKVFCTETRPRYQGRITAEELTKIGIPTTMVVDSAVSTYIKEADIVFVGADLITAEMSAVNKVGTLNLALGSKRVNTPFFVATLIAKFDPETILGKIEEIEMRDSKEIWEKPPKKLKILNPAFDITPRNLINAYVTEHGILTPDSLLLTARDNCPWMFRGLRL